MSFARRRPRASLAYVLTDCARMFRLEEQVLRLLEANSRGVSQPVSVRRTSVDQARYLPLVLGRGYW